MNPDLVVRDDDGEIYTVRYDAVNAMLLNEFIKEHRKAEDLEKQIAALPPDYRGSTLGMSHVNRLYVSSTISSGYNVQ